MMGLNSDDSSFIDFGKPDEFRTQSGTLTSDTMVTFGFNDDFYWSTYTQAIKFSDSVQFAIDGAPYTVFDSGSSHIMVPPRLFEPIIDGIMAGTGNKA